MHASSLAPATLLTAAAWHAGPALCAHVPPLADRLAITRRLADPGAVALTFDDGPHPFATPRVLAELDARRARATFFLVGEQVRRYASLAQEIAAAGHTIALHGDSHRCEGRLSPTALTDDWARGIEAIHAATGSVPTMRRPPYGAASGVGLLLACRVGIRTVLWSRWGKDWRAGATPASVAATVFSTLPEGGEIILLHDSDHYGAAECWRATVGALPTILDEIETADLRLVTL
jgi:peptidoglycan/xylan/chitin deacetylase (PgdA/CDA1 family)